MKSEYWIKLVNIIYILILYTLTSEYFVVVAYSEGYGGTWPLTDREIIILDANQESLVEILDSTEIISKLYASKFINMRQKEFISKQSYDYEKAEVLLDFLYRSSLSNYWKMITYLQDTNQKPAAKILLDGGGRWMLLCNCIILK